MGSNTESKMSIDVNHALPKTTDVTNERALKAQRLLDAGLVGVLYFDITGGITDANDTFLEMLGYTRADLQAGRVDWVELTPPELRERDAAPVADLFATGKHLPFEKEYVRKDGTRVPVLVASAFNEGSQTEGVGFVVDIRAQKQAEQEARERSQEIITIFESMTDAFFALDGEWRFTYINAEAQRLLHRTREELIGRVLWYEFPETVEATFGQEFRRAMSDLVPVTVEDYYPPLGAWLEVRAFPSPGGAGLSVYFRNVSRRKLADQERERLLAEQARLVSELQEASVRQRRFLREMLLGFTDGRLRLCDSTADLPRPLLPLSDWIELTSQTLRRLRKQVVADAEGLYLPLERLHDFETAVGEAAMNAVQHGGGGRGRVHGDPQSGVVQVWIEDEGEGITEDFIHRAIEQGWTTGGFGQGFFLMRTCADRMYLLTGPTGTTVVLEQERTPPEPAWLK